MLIVKQFLSFEEAKDIWESLERQTFHYPFQTYAYQKLFTKNFSQMDNIFLLGVFDNKIPIALGTFEKIGTTIVFLGMKHVLGKEEVTDFGDILIADTYHTQAKEIWNVLLNFLSKYAQQIQLDYVREDSITYQVLQKRNTQSLVQKVSPFLSLPISWDDYLSSLVRKDRHELKRKMKRLNDVSWQFVQNTNTPQVFSDFIRLHRLSDSAKEHFMSQSMENFFHDLSQADFGFWKVGFASLFAEKTIAAIVMYFFNTSHILLYNSGFDPKYKSLSVGIVSKALFIRESIIQHYKTFDFLRGDERYKYDLGAKDQKLFKISLDI